MEFSFSIWNASSFMNYSGFPCACTYKYSIWTKKFSIKRPVIIIRVIFNEFGFAPAGSRASGMTVKDSSGFNMRTNGRHFQPAAYRTYFIQQESSTLHLSLLFLCDCVLVLCSKINVAMAWNVVGILLMFEIKFCWTKLSVYHAYRKRFSFADSLAHSHSHLALHSYRMKETAR